MNRRDSNVKIKRGAYHLTNLNSLNKFKIVLHESDEVPLVMDPSSTVIDISKTAKDTLIEQLTSVKAWLPNHSPKQHHRAVYGPEKMQFEGQKAFAKDLLANH